MIRVPASLRSLVAVSTVVAAALVAATVTPSGQAARPAPAPTAAAEPGRPLRLLFLGHDKDHHPSGKLLPLIAAPLARRGIQMTHVSTPAEALVPSTLKHYDGLVIYANHETITPEQEQALVDFVEGGKAIIALHCASFMFTKAPRFIPIIGGQFLKHGTGDFIAEIIAPDHPVMKGLKPFSTWDETYVHTRHNPVDRTVLMERVDKDGREPYTWVRTQGKGRVFYSAYGHDERTWGNPGFLQLVQQGIVWAVDDQARAAWQRLKMPEVEYVDGFNVPNYEKRDPAPKYQLPMTAADSQKFIQTPAEFKVELFAQEPMIGGKPITFSFDERGRLWVIEAVDYPNRVLRGGEGDDRIKILEDTNGDGKADKVTVFADHLNLATSLVFANGGVIVAAAPHMLFLQDTNGDGKADVKKVVSTGWGIQDTHAGPSNLQYGVDNFVWGVVGYSGFDGQMNGAAMKFSQGVYRYKPDGSQFEYVTGSTNNTWGLGFSETGDVFGSTANNDPSFFVAIPNRFFDAVPEFTSGVRTIGGPGYQSAAQFYTAHFLTPYIRQVDVWSGYTAAAGHQLYTARSFPQRYWNRIAFITEPTAHIVGQGVMESQGAGFVTRDGWNLMAGAEEWFSPVHAQVGPDGAVWVADWYAFINQHNPTPPGHSNGPGNAYETSMRDKTRGRIYRVVYRDAPAAAKVPALSKADPAGLIAALKSDNMLWRLHAQRLLVERGKLDVVPQLVALTADPKVDAIGTNGAAFHALWTLHGLGAITTTTSDAGRAAVRALAHPAAGVRKAAAMVLPASPDAADATTAAILGSKVLADADLHTRLAVFLRLAELPASEAAGKAIYAASLDPTNFGDRWLSRAIYIAAARHKTPFLTSYQADPAKLAIDALPIGLRLGRARPDWRQPAAAVLASDWKAMEVPGSWESRGLTAFDGVVWFTRQIDWPADRRGPATIRFGRIGNIGEVWVNGTSVAAAAVDPTAGRSPQIFEVPDGVLKPGANTISVRIQNLRGDGGFLGAPEALVVQSGETRTALAGPWRYRVERQTNAAALYSRPGELAAHLASAGTPPPADAVLAAPSVTAKADVTLRLGVLKDQLKWDQPALTVGAGQLVDLVFTNTDVMPHNFILGTPGSLPAIGVAADALMSSPAGQVQQFVPDLPQILASTRLLEPGQSITIQFRAPGQAGAYPYVCTFPGHWRLMNGVLTVTAGRQSEP
ncbi:MAG: PVC-type heme-binding CxxCH protein [Vicinamibacteraceae bacterium]